MVCLVGLDEVNLGLRHSRYGCEPIIRDNHGDRSLWTLLSNAGILL